MNFYLIANRGLDVNLPSVLQDVLTTANLKLVLNPFFIGPPGAGGGANSLDELSDVDLTTNPPSDGQSLVYTTATGWTPGTVSSGDGVTDHGLLTGLADDDHNQYFNTTRGDARYYTQGQVDTVVNAKEDSFTKNTGFNRDFGNTATTVTVGNDSRLSDARTPIAHNHTKSEITDFNDGDYATTAQGALADTAIQTIPASSLDDLTDVDTTTAVPTEGQSLVYTVANGWIPQTVDTGGAGVTDHGLLNGLADDDHAQYFNTTRGDARYYTQTAVDSIASGKENAFTKNTAFNKDFGTALNTVTQGNDSRLSDARTPTAHAHAATDVTSGAFADSRISQASVIQHETALTVTESQVSDLGNYETAFTKNSAFNKAFGTVVNTVTQGNDGRLSDARTPLTHTHVKANITDFSDGDYATPAQGALADTALQSIPAISLNDLTGVDVSAPSDGQSLVYTTAGGWTPATVSSGSGVTDHGLLDGLADDDHNQYHNNTRGDARYYTQAQVDSAVSNKENAFTKNTAFNKDFGSIVGTVTQGNDSRLSDARTPTSHNHVKADITDFSDGDYATATQGTTADSALQTITSESIKSLSDVNTGMTPSDGQVLTYDTTNGWQSETIPSGVTDHSLLTGLDVDDHTQYFNTTRGDARYYTQGQLNTSLSDKENSFSKSTAFNKDFGVIAGTVTQGNDSRLSDARTPTAHNHTLSEITDFNAANYATGAEGDLASSALQNLSGSSIKDLSDVFTSMTPSDGQALVYDTTNGWQAETLSGSGDMLASANLSDLANITTARTNLNVDVAGTDNSTSVTLAGTPDYLTLAGQAITRNAINLASHVTGLLPVVNGGTNATTATAARTNLAALGTALPSAQLFVGNGSGVATGVALSGDATVANTGALTLASNAVTLPKMAQIATATLLGRSTAGTGNVQALTAAATRTLLGLVVGTNVQAYTAILAATTASFTTALNTKLSGIATAATANSTDVALRARSSHTGTQLLSTISNVPATSPIATQSYWTGTATAYGAIGTKDPNTIYLVEA